MKLDKNFRMRSQFLQHSSLVIKTKLLMERLKQPCKSSRSVWLIDINLQVYANHSSFKLWQAHLAISYSNFLFVDDLITNIQNSSAISSADLFGNGMDDAQLDMSASDLINRITFQVHIFRNIFIENFSIY